MLTWVYDEIGCPGAIVEEYCVRNLVGEAVAWVFGVSLFSLKGEHIGWYEDGVFYDIDNHVLGFLTGARGLEQDMPALAPEPSLPKLSKRPYVPTLRGRRPRPAAGGWSIFCLSTYLEFGVGPEVRGFQRVPGAPAYIRSRDLSH